MSGRFAKGCRRDAPEKLARKQPAIAHPRIAAALATALPASVTLLASTPGVLDQNQTGSCTAHSSASALYTAFSAANAPLPWVPSPKTIYAATRALERATGTPSDGSLPALTDSGAELSDVATALAEYGVKPIASPSPEGFNSDVDASNVNDEPDVAALETAATRLVTGEYAIDPSIANLSDVVAASLAAGIPVWVGFFCDSAFENLTAGQVAGVPNQSDPNGGGHAVYLYGYSGPAGSRVFLLRNSWGSGWCDGGDCQVSEAWLSAAWTLFPMAVARAAGKSAA